MTEVENRRPLKTRSKPWAQALAKFLARRLKKPVGISVADDISIKGMIFAGLGGAALLTTPHNQWYYLAAAACIQLRLLCNLMDGLVAIESGLKSKLGDMFNEVPDRFADVALLVCAGHAAREIELGWACAACAVFTAYLRLFGGTMGFKQDFCGPMAKQQRMFTLTVACIATPLLWWSGHIVPVMDIALWIILTGSALTAVRRIYRIGKAMHARP